MKIRILIFLILPVVTIVSTGGIYLLEGSGDSAFSSLFNSLWWTVVTVTTVGYGDMSPVTVNGKIFGMMILAGGVIINSIIISLVSDWFFTFRSARYHGLKAIDIKEHILICSDDTHFINSIIHENLRFYHSNKIVIVSSFKEHPLLTTPYEKTQWVSGLPYNTDILKKASVQHVHIAYVSFKDDSETVLTVMQIENLTGGDALTMALDNDSEYHKHLQNVGCDYALNPYDIYVPLMVQAYQGPGAPTLIREIILRGENTPTIESVKIPSSFDNRPWMEYILACKKDFNQIPLALVDKEGIEYTNPSSQKPIPPQSRALNLVSPKGGYRADKKDGTGIPGLAERLPTGHILVCADQEVFIRRILVELELAGIDDEIYVLSKLRRLPDLSGDSRVQWIHTKISSDAGYYQARVKEAKIAFVDHEQDNHTLMEVLRLENLTDGKIFTIASFQGSETGKRLEEAGCDFILNADELTAPILSQAAIHQGVGRLIEEIISQDPQSESMIVRQLHHDWKERSWLETVTFLKSKQDYLAISLIKKGKTSLIINPSSETRVHSGDSLLFIAKTQKFARHQNKSQKKPVKKLSIL
ncbi:MAG: NAD-binding protein [SAR324 cluster bacterium]|nr:NAD-binding protein [SAR324 cluster bacterium]